jgi:hypothetical protein
VPTVRACAPRRPAWRDRHAAPDLPPSPGPPQAARCSTPTSCCASRGSTRRSSARWRRRPAAAAAPPRLRRRRRRCTWRHRSSTWRRRRRRRRRRTWRPAQPGCARSCGRRGPSRRSSPGTTTRIRSRSRSGGAGSSSIGDDGSRWQSWRRAGALRPAQSPRRARGGGCAVSSPCPPRAAHASTLRAPPLTSAPRSDPQAAPGAAAAAAGRRRRVPRAAAARGRPSAASGTRGPARAGPRLGRGPAAPHVPQPGGLHAVGSG